MHRGREIIAVYDKPTGLMEKGPKKSSSNANEQDIKKQLGVFYRFHCETIIEKLRRVQIGGTA